MPNYILNLLNKTNSDFYDIRVGYSGDCGIDLYFPEDVIVTGNTLKFISLQVACEMFDNDGNLCSYYLYPRSSISKTPLMLANSVGIIDSGYRGDIIVALRNLSSEDYHIKKGDRLFQICAPSLGNITLCLLHELSTSDRGSNGFGSTGK